MVTDNYSLDAQVRSVTGKKVGQLRRVGMVPAVIYGAGKASTPIQIAEKALTTTLLKAGGTHLIDINLDGSSQTVIAREVQRDILRGTILHVDFLAVDADKPIETEVPVHFINESPAVETKQGIIVAGTNTVRIEALPRYLIDVIEVDLSGLTRVGDAIFVRDLVLNENVRAVSDPDELVVRVAATAAAISDEAAQEIEGVSAEPEVIARGKQEEEDF
ncbi:MAG: 50S ribosomal protein L25 [Phototrophicales bacterium]|nr:MAG: 50S ribosomal protein L25 [Phototrophicales bacterium]